MCGYIYYQYSPAVLNSNHKVIHHTRSFNRGSLYINNFVSPICFCPENDVCFYICCIFSSAHQTRLSWMQMLWTLIRLRSWEQSDIRVHFTENIDYLQTTKMVTGSLAGKRVNIAFKREGSGSVVECLTQDRKGCRFEPHHRHCIVSLSKTH